MAVAIFRNPRTGTTMRVSGANIAVLTAWGWERLDDGPAATPPDPFPQYLLPSDLAQEIAGKADLVSGRVPDAQLPARLSQVQLEAALVARWAPDQAVTANDYRLSPDGTIIKRNSSGTTRATWDATEIALWTVVAGGGGGGSTTDASLLTSGILPAARIADASVADAKLASGTALTPTERTKLSGIATGATANRTDAATDTLLAGKAPLASPAFTGTPTGITKTHVGLGNVDNTADTAKPISTAQQTALDGKQAAGSYVQYVGTSASPISSAATARPSGTGPVYWMCAAGVTPTNAIAGDLVWNAT